jgi:hypothetical protein
VPEKGKVGVQAGNSSEILSGPGAVEIQPPTKLSVLAEEPTPAWLADPSPSPEEIRAGEAFAQFFKPGQEALSPLAEASADKDKGTRQLAIRALGVIGDVEMAAEPLYRRNDPVARQAAIAVLRSVLAQGPEAAKNIRNVLDNSWKDTAHIYEKMLLGYTEKEAKDEATYASLVKELSAKEVGLRELAITNLTELTGRDRLGYDPENPEGAGAKAWQELLKEKELPLKEKEVAPKAEAGEK